MDFIIGCNYWASNAGTEMWKNWDEAAIREDLGVLHAHGVTHLRVFPNWRDFQPVIPMLGGGGAHKEYRLENDVKPQNPYFLDEVMLERFSVLCDICDMYNIKLIVGLITGWMSGRLFIPSVLYGKNLYTDPTALWLQQKLVTGFVRRFKDRETIYAWDLGNECNCMSRAENREVAASWTAIISNAIKAADNTRPVVSGMHSLRVDKQGWSLYDQAEWTDILTTHPYPYWVEHASKDEIGSFRTSMHATCETKLYADIGGKPCLAEEIGTMGPMVCSDEQASAFLRCNLFSNFVHHASGVMWWCAHEQTNLDTAPYTWNMVEVELGMMDTARNPKPVLQEMKRFSDFLVQFDTELPPPKEDAVCILTQSQDQWGVAYMSWCLAKQNDMSLRFAYCEQEIPEAEVYMLPSLKGHLVMPAENFKELKARVYRGATLYISIDTGILSDFQALTGLKVLDSSRGWETESINLDGETINFTRERQYRIEAVGATVLATDTQGIPAITVYTYGKGKVYFVNFPLESMLLNERKAFDTNLYKVYGEIFRKTLLKKKVTSPNPYITVTEHEGENGTYGVAINHSPSAQKPMLKLKEHKIGEILYGDINELKPFDAVIFKLTNK